MNSSEMVNCIQEGLKQEINKAMRNSRLNSASNFRPKPKLTTAKSAPPLQSPQTPTPISHSLVQPALPACSHRFSYSTQVFRPIQPWLLSWHQFTVQAICSTISSHWQTIRVKTSQPLQGTDPQVQAAFQALSTFFLSSTSSFLEIPFISSSQPTAFAPSFPFSAPSSWRLSSTCTSSCSSTHWENHYSILPSIFKTSSQVQIPLSLPTLAFQIKNNRTGHLIERPRNRRGDEELVDKPSNTSEDGIEKVKFALYHPNRTASTSHQDGELKTTGTYWKEDSKTSLQTSLSASCCDMFRILAGAGLLDKVDLTMARRLYNPSTNWETCLVGPYAGNTWKYLSSNPNLLSVSKLFTLGFWFKELVLKRQKLSYWKDWRAPSIFTREPRLDELAPASRNIPWLTYLTASLEERQRPTSHSLRTHISGCPLAQ